MSGYLDLRVKLLGSNLCKSGAELFWFEQQEDDALKEHCHQTVKATSF